MPVVNEHALALWGDWQYRVEHYRDRGCVGATLSGRRLGRGDVHFRPYTRGGVGFVDHFLRAAAQDHTIEGGGDRDVLRGITVEQYGRATFDVGSNRTVGVLDVVGGPQRSKLTACLLYTSDAADE